MGDLFFNLDKMQLDILQEIGNIGSGNAITALSQLLNKKIDMKVPDVKLLEFKEMANIIGDPENLIIGILVNINCKEMNGIVMFLIENNDANELINNLFIEYKNNISENNEVDKLKFSALKEIGNILISAYVSSLSNLLNINPTMSVPYMSIDMAGAILSVPAIEFSKYSDQVLFIESIFATDNKNISGYFVLVPDINSFSFFKSLA